MAGVLTWFCVGLYGRGPAGNRALKALSCARRDLGPRAVSAGNVVAAGQDAGVMAGRGRDGAGEEGEMERAARQLGVTSTLLRQHGWKTASPERVKAAGDNPPNWLVAARERRHQKRARQRGRRDRASMAARLGVQVRAARDRGITPGEIGGLLAARPGWVAAGQERRQAQIAREAEDKLRRELADALATSVHEAWFQELKHAVSDADAGVIDARWAPEVRRAKREARQLAGELTAEQVRARIGRERDAAFEAARYRAGQLPSRALGG
jgi:hypothetical protein